MKEERLARILEIYKPECRYLVDVDLDYPKAKGKFRFGNVFYTAEEIKLEHMTAIEAQLCLNQLCYSAFSEWISKGRFDKTVSFERFLELMKENMFIIDSRIKFRKPISTNNEVHGKIELKKIKRFSGLYLAFLDYEIEQGKSKGKLELAIKLQGEQNAKI